jgi:hypothetical protein
MFSDAPGFRVDARIRQAPGGWSLEFGKSRYGIRRNSKLMATRFVVSTEWQTMELTQTQSRRLAGKLFDATPLVYRACTPYWDGEDLISPNHLEFFVGDQRFTGKKFSGTDRVHAHGADGELMLEARVPWQDSESGVDWVIDLHYKLDDPNVQLALLLFPIACSAVYTWWEYASNQSTGI